MKRRIYIFIIIGGLIANHVYAQKNNTQDKLDYIYAFTEATKQSLLGNYREALLLYNNCIKVNPKSAAANFQMSNIYMKMGIMEQSLNHAKKAYSLYDSNIWYAVHLANIYQMLGENKKSLEIYEKIKLLDPENIEYTFNYAVLLQLNGDYIQSLKILKDLEKNYGIEPQISVQKHRIYSKLGDNKKAVEELKKLVMLMPQEIKYKGLLAEYFDEIGNSKEARKLYRELMEQDSTNSLVLLSYAEFLKNNNEITEALEFYKNIVKRDILNEEEFIQTIFALLDKKEILNEFTEEIKELIDIYFNENKESFRIKALYAEYYIRIEKYKESITYINQLIDKYPKNIVFWEQKLRVHEQLEEYDSILHIIDDALVYHPKSTLIHMYGAMAHMQKEQYKLAVDYLYDALNTAQSEKVKRNIYSFMGDVFYNLGEADSAFIYYEKVLEDDNKNIVVRNNYGYYLAEKEKNLKKALKLSEYTIEKEPLNPTYLDTYGWILYKMGKEKKALKYLQLAAKQLDNPDVEVYFHIGEVLHKMGKHKEALEYYKIAYKASLGRNEKIIKRIESLERKMIK